MSNTKSTPAFMIYLNNTRLTSEQELQIKDIMVISRINTSSKFLFTFNDPDGDWIDSDDIKIGVKVKIMMGYKDDVSEVIQGDITGMNASFSAVTGRTVTVIGYDVIHRLTKNKENKSWLDKSESDVMKEIIQARSLQCDVCDLGASKKFILQKEQSDLEYISGKVEKYDLTLSVEGRKIIIKEFSATKNEDVTLEWGKSLIMFHPVSNADNVITGVDLYNWDWMKMKAVKSSKTKDDSGSDDLKEVAKKFGDRTEYMLVTDNIDQNTGDKLAMKALKSQGRDFIHAEGLAQGNTAIICGCVIKVNGIPKRWDRLYYVKQAMHILIPNEGYNVEFECQLYTGKQETFSSKSESSSGKKDNKDDAATVPEPPKKTKTPQLKNVKWKDKEKKDISKAFIGDKVYITADVTDIKNGTTVNIYILVKDDDENNVEVISFGVPVVNKKVEAGWNVIFNPVDDDNGNSGDKEKKEYTLPKYIISMDCPKHSIEDVQSDVLEIIDWIELTIIGFDDKPLANKTIKLVFEDGTERSCTTNSDGMLREEKIISRTANVISNDSELVKDE